MLQYYITVEVKSSYLMLLHLSLKFPDHNKNHKTIYPMIIVEIITVLLNYVQDYKNIYNPYWEEAVHV